MAWAEPHNPHGLYTDETRTLHGQLIGRISRRKKTGIGGALKGLRVNDLEIAFLKNLSQKRRSLAIVTRKILIGGIALTDDCAQCVGCD